MGQVLAREVLPELQTGRRWAPAWSTGLRFPLVLLGLIGTWSFSCHQLAGVGRWPSLGAEWAEGRGLCHGQQAPAASRAGVTVPVFAIAPTSKLRPVSQRDPSKLGSGPPATRRPARGVVTAQELLSGGKGGRRRNKGECAWRRPPCVSQRHGEDLSSERRNGEMLPAPS